jgi:hypothetical protein
LDAQAVGLAAGGLALAGELDEVAPWGEVEGEGFAAAFALRVGAGDRDAVLVEQFERHVARWVLDLDLDGAQPLGGVGGVLAVRGGGARGRERGAFEAEGPEVGVALGEEVAARGLVGGQRGGAGLGVVGLKLLVAREA